MDSRRPEGGLFTDGDSLELSGNLVTICPWWEWPSSRSDLEEQLTRAAANVRRRLDLDPSCPAAGSKYVGPEKKSAGDDFCWIGSSV